MSYDEGAALAMTTSYPLRIDRCGLKPPALPLLRCARPDRIGGIGLVGHSVLRQRRVMTTSRYSLGTTSEAGPARFRLFSRSLRSRSSARGAVTEQGGEGLAHRSRPSAEDVDEMRRRAVAEIEHSWRDLDRRRLLAKEGLEMRLGAPECGCCRPGGNLASADSRSGIHGRRS